MTHWNHLRRLELAVLTLLVLLFFYTYGRATEPASDIASGGAASFDPWAAEVDIFAVDIEQRTCALEVVMRPIALRVPDVFLRAMDATVEPRDMDPDGTALACT